MYRLEKEEGNDWQAWVKWMLGAKEIHAPILARRSLFSKMLGQVGTAGQEWVSGIPLNVQLSGGVW